VSEEKKPTPKQKRRAERVTAVTKFLRDTAATAKRIAATFKISRVCAYNVIKEIKSTPGLEVKSERKREGLRGCESKVYQVSGRASAQA
jgi:hypothetical protein